MPQGTRRDRMRDAFWRLCCHRRQRGEAVWFFVFRCSLLSKMTYPSYQTRRGSAVKSMAAWTFSREMLNIRAIIWT